MDDRPILICYDGSDPSRLAIDAAAGLLGKRRAVVVDVAPLLTGGESMALASSAMLAPEVLETQESGANELAAQGAELARAKGFDASARTEVSGPVWEGVLDVADEIDAAAIVVGSQGLRGVRALFEGSVSRDLADHSTRPLVTVPPLHRHRI
jgi:nucleotide-binding universal stress UspA family protein